jgi:hypothetical protein
MVPLVEVEQQVITVTAVKAGVSLLKVKTVSAAQEQEVDHLTTVIMTITDQVGEAVLGFMGCFRNSIMLL